MNREPVEEVRPAGTPEEMRAELFRLRYYDPLVRSAWDAADYHGLSGEDRYTMIAYMALRHAAALQTMALDRARITLDPQIIPKEQV